MEKGKWFDLTVTDEWDTSVGLYQDLPTSDYFFCPEYAPVCLTGTAALLWRLIQFHSPRLSEDHSEAQYGLVPGRRLFHENQPRFLSFPFITWLPVKPLVGNFWRYHPVAIVQGGQLHSVIGGFISALDWKFSTKSVWKSEAENWETRNLCHLHTLSQYMTVSGDVIYRHS